VYTFCLLFSYLIKVVVLLIFIFFCYQHVLVNKDIQNKCQIVRMSDYGDDHIFTHMLTNPEYLVKIGHILR